MGVINVVGIVLGILVVTSGLYVLSAGEWRPHGLKFAGVAFATASGIVGLIGLAHGGRLWCSAVEVVCISDGVYYILRNLTFIIFNIAIGRDAIRFKNGERRCGARGS